MTEKVQEPVTAEEAKPKTSVPAFSANEKRPAIPNLKDLRGAYTISVQDHGDLQRIFGGSSDDLGSLLAQQCFTVSGTSPEVRDKEGEAVLLVAEIAPRDALEGILASQMAATHIAIMRHAGQLANAKHLETIELHERILTKLSRTFTAQMEALRKHRNGGKQVVTVQHVNVEDGGQAIVGNVTTGEGNRGS